METGFIEPRLREFLTERAEREGIAAAYLFGSVARGTAGPRSDVAVGVLYQEDPPLTLEGLGLRLEGDLESLLGKPVQVVVLNRAPAAYTLHIAIQAALDVAAHIVADKRLGEPQNNRELFELPARYGWISRELTGSLREMVRFRNIVVHGYERLNAAIVEKILRNHLDDLLRL